MQILVFDIDGTLTATNRVDGRLFRQALDEVLPEWGGTDFGEFTEFTDAAIVRDLCPECTHEEYEAIADRVRGRFLARLRAAAADEPDAFLPVPGAREVFGAAVAAGWVPAIATGAWRPSAELKLDAAGIGFDGVPFATSSEAPRRADIIRLAVAEAARGAEADTVVYVGDGVWDVRACRELGIGFVGRGGSKGERRLLEGGARAVIPDYAEPARLFELLREPSSLVPASAS